MSLLRFAVRSSSIALFLVPSLFLTLLTVAPAVKPQERPSLISNAPPAVPRQPSSTETRGCGPAQVRFHVKREKNRQAVPAPSLGTALFVFLQDDEAWGTIPRPTTRFGIDGFWVGATHANSYFFVTVDPGEHHVCASWQPGQSMPDKPSQSTVSMNLTAVAGQTYYLHASDKRSRSDSDEYFFVARGAAVPYTVFGPPALYLESVGADAVKVEMATFNFDRSKQGK